MSRVCITGGVGFIGTHLSLAAAKLIGASSVMVIDSFTDYYPVAQKRKNQKLLQDAGIEVFEIDLNSPQIKEQLRDVNFIYHLAAQPGISAATPFNDYLTNNILATQNLLSSINPDTKIVNVATSSIYGRDASLDEETRVKPCSWYGVTKLAAEQLILARCREEGLPAVSLRLFSVYGPLERPDKLYPRLIHSALSGESFPLCKGSLSHTRSFTYISDIVDGCLRLLSNESAIEVLFNQGEIFNIGNDQEHSTKEGLELVQEISGVQLKIKEVAPRPGDQKRTVANINKARKLLGFVPKVSLREGLERHYEFMKENY